MTHNPNSKRFDLKVRTFKFAKEIRLFVKSLPNPNSNLEDARQLIHSSGSFGANYIEANESLSKKDFLFRSKICRKRKQKGSGKRYLN